MNKIFTRAWRDSKRQIGGWPALVSAILLPLLGASYHFWRDGRDAVSAEAYIWAIYVLAPLAVTFCVLLLFNAVAAPYRILAESNAAKESAQQLEIDAIKKLYDQSNDQVKALQFKLTEAVSLKARIKKQLSSIHPGIVTAIDSGMVDIYVVASEGKLQALFHLVDSQEGKLLIRAIEVHGSDDGGYGNRFRNGEPFRDPLSYGRCYHITLIPTPHLRAS